MPDFRISTHELDRRKELVASAQAAIMDAMQVERGDECMIALYRGFFLQISYSETHSLVAICFARALKDEFIGVARRINEMNLTSVFGSHAVNEDANCYTYRAVYWLDGVLTPKRWLEFLDRCTEEAARGFSTIGN